MTTTNTYPNAHLEGLLTHYNAQGWQHCDRGTCSALRAFVWTNELGLDALIVRDMPFSGDLPAFMQTFDEAGITEFTLCEQSTALMEDLHFLMAQGWQIIGTYERQDRHSPLLGLRVRKAVA